MGWIEALLPPGLGPALGAVLLAASFATSFITAAFGIGGGVLMLAIMAAVVPPASLIPVHGLIQLGSNAGRAASLVRHVRRPGMGGFAVGALAGVGLGGAVAVNLSPALVEAGVGLFVLWSVLATPPAWLGRWPIVSGAVSSVLTMFFGATGPFVATHVKALGLDRLGHVATHAALMTLQHGLKTLAFGFLGFAFGAWGWIIAGMVLTGLLGTLAGRSVLTRLTDARFRRALDILLVLIALRLVWSGASGLLAPVSP
jgi:uncharacterized protein